MEPNVNLLDFDLPDRPDIHQIPHQGPVWFRRNEDARLLNFRSWYGPAIADHLSISTGLDDPEMRWSAVRPLGFGGHGWAALYERQSGTQVEQMVVKDSMPPLSPLNETRVLNRRVPNEAYIMDILNDNDVPTTLRLLAFGRYRSGNPPEPIPGGPPVPDPRPLRYRYYLEYCPHGDLKQLIRRYRHFAEFFPEIFIWHAIRSLAHTADAFKNVDLSDPHGYTEDYDNEIIHFDMKPENVFLADPHTLPDPNDPEDVNPPWLLLGDALHDLPSIKLGDFGLASITRPGDVRNPGLFAAGTPWYMPPEQEHMHHDLRHWWRRRNNYPWTGFGRFDEKHNIFGIGAVAWSMLTTEQFCARSVYQNGRHLDADNHAMKPVLTTMRGSVPKPGKKVHKREEKEYSLELRTLIRQCLHPDPRKRPTVYELIEEAEQGIIDTIEREGNATIQYTRGGRDFRRKRNPNPHRVYYRGNEINDMLPGTLHYHLFNHIEVQSRVLRPGWVSVTREARRVNPQHPSIHWTRGLPNAPIISPKVRWLPQEKTYWLLRKTRDLGYLADTSKRRTRWRRPYRLLHHPREVFEDTPHGPREIVYEEDANFNHDDREKDVWVEGRGEFGSEAQEDEDINWAWEMHRGS